MNDLLVAGTPLPVFVKIPPTKLGKPVKILPGFQGFGVAFNSRGELVFAEYYGNGDILFLDKGGNPLRKIKKSQHGFKSLFGVAVDDDDNVYATEFGNGSMFKFDKQCVKIKAVKPAVRGFNARCIAVSGGYIIVADYANHQVLVFTRDLDLCLDKTISCSGSPCGLTSDQDGKIYVCIHCNNCVQVFNSCGALLYSFSNKGSTSHKLDYPHSICVTGDFVYVSEWGNTCTHCVSVFTKKGEFITSFGKGGSREGEFNCPSGLAVDNDGVLYVCDLNNSRIQLF